MGNIAKGSANITDIRKGSSAVLKVYKGSTLVWPPSSPPPSGTASVLCLHFNGSNGATSTTDSSASAHSLTMTGDAVISTAQSKFGGSSLYIPDTGGNVSAGYSSDFDFGTGDFTIELWYYPLGVSQLGALLQGSPICGDEQQWFIQFNPESYSPPKFGFGKHCVGMIVSEELELATGEWHHLAITRDSGFVRVFHNGAVLASDTYTDAVNIGSESELLIGETAGGTSGYSDTPYGYIEDVRIVKGLAVYTCAFTPPAAQLSATATAVACP